MNNFFTEKQYLSTINNHEKILDEFVDLVFSTESLIDFPKIKTTNNKVVNINEFPENRKFKILNVTDINKILKRMNLTLFDEFVTGHKFSLDHLTKFADRVLEQLDNGEASNGNI
jgi:hypothetical protein